MLSGKIAVITGGARGIGAAAAAKLAAQGADIAVIYAGSSALAAQVCSQCSSLHGVKARAYQCSVADFDAVRQTVTQIRSDFGTVHILVNNAGITRDGLVLDVATVLTTAHVRVKELSGKDLPGGRSTFTVRFEVKNIAELEAIRTKLLNIRDVTGSKRGQN